MGIRRYPMKFKLLGCPTYKKIKIINPNDKKVFYTGYINTPYTILPNSAT